MATPNNVHADGLVAAVASASADEYLVDGLSAEVAWQDRSLGTRASPLAFVLFQDPALSGKDAITDATSQYGPFISNAMPLVTNEGDLLPFPSGSWIEEPNTPDPTPDDLLFKIVRTGSLYDSAEWAWKLDRHDSDDWTGMDDLRWQHHFEEPYGTFPNVAGCNPTICYSKVHQRILISILDGSQVSIKYRPLHGDAFTTVTVNLPESKQAITGLDAMAMVELPDGTIRLLYLYEPPGAATGYYDMAIMSSRDGGLNWELVKEQVVTDILGIPSRIRAIRAAQSGDYTRLEMWYLPTSGSQGLVSASSSDRMATWKAVRATPDGKDDIASSTFHPYLFAIAAVDDQGSFIRMRRPTLTAGGLRVFFELATRDSQFVNIAQTLDSPFPAPGTSNMVGFWMASGAGRIYAMIMRDDGSGNAGWSYSSFIIPANRVAQGYDPDGNPKDRWTLLGVNDWLEWNGGNAYTPVGGDMVWAGDRLLLFSMPQDRASGTALSDLKGFSLSTFGGPSRRPLRLPYQTNTDVTHLFARSWNASLGPPVGTGASSYTPWSTTSAGTPSTDHKLDRFDVLCDASVDRLGWSFTSLVTSLTQHIGDAGLVQWVTRETIGGRGAENTRPTISAAELRTPRWGAHFQTGSRHAGLTSEVAVHIFGDGGFALYDVSSLTTLHVEAAGALAGITDGAWYDFRLAIAETDVAERTGSNAHFVELAWSKIEENASWSSSGIHTLTASSLSFSSESVSFGVLGAPSVDHDVSFAECAVSRPFAIWVSPQGNAQGTLSQLPFSNPGKMRGFDCLPFDQLAAQGIEVRWGGAGGFISDNFRAPVEYANGAALILGNSPQSRWNSTSTDTQSIVLDATQILGQRATWRHSGISFFGGNSRSYKVEYSESSSFTNPSTFHLDGVRYSVVIEKHLGGLNYRVSGADLSKWKDGELSGWYFRAGSYGRFGKIRMNAGDEIEFQISGSPVANGLVAGSTIFIWSGEQTHLFHDHPLGVRVRTTTAGLTSVYPRYMRVTVDGQASQGRPIGDSWHIGRMQAGLTLPISVPMDWETQDETEDPNVNLTTMVNGTRNAYKQGEPRMDIRGTSRGDVDRWRVAFRSMVRNLSGYSEKPIVLCTDDRQLHLRSKLVRFIGSTQFANSGWRYNRTTSRWEQVGDLQMRFEEEV